MKKSRFTDSQIMAVLKQAEAGTAVPDLRFLTAVRKGHPHSGPDHFLARQSWRDPL